jgi:hypothetical protein
MSKAAVLVHDVRLIDDHLRITNANNSFKFMSVGRSNFLREIIPGIQRFGREILLENMGIKPHLVIYGHGTPNQDGMWFCNENIVLETAEQFQPLANIFDTILLSGCSVLGTERGFLMCQRLSRVTNSRVLAPTLTQISGVRIRTTADLLSPQARGSVSYITVTFIGPVYQFHPPTGQRAACQGNCVPSNLQQTN